MTARELARWGVFASFAALLTIAAEARAQQVSWASSVGYAQGSYIFSETFRTLSWLNSLTVSGGRIDVSASLPVLVQNGTAVNYVAGIPLPTGGPDNGAVRRRDNGQVIPVRPGRRGGASHHMQGALGDVVVADSTTDSLSVGGSGSYEAHFGDPVVGVSLAALRGSGAFRSLNFEASAKIPVSSVESGVGTGAWDYGAGTSLVLESGRALFFANATWWMLGDMPDLVLRDALFYSASLGLPVSSRWSVLTTAAASTTVIEGSSPPVSAHVMISRFVSDGASFSLGAGVGLSESASDFTASVGWTTRLFGGKR